MIGSALRVSSFNCRCFARQARYCFAITRSFLQVRDNTPEHPISFIQAVNWGPSFRNASPFHSSAVKAQKPTQDETAEAQVDETAEGKQLTQRQKLKKIFAEYGTTGVVFHVSISLTSLGICYAAVKSGLDVQAALQKIGLSTESLVATEASTFVVAYACHKVFAPLRMFMTITCTPLIVRKLRKVGILKEPLNQ